MGITKKIASFARNKYTRIAVLLLALHSVNEVSREVDRVSRIVPDYDNAPIRYVAEKSGEVLPDITDDLITKLKRTAKVTEEMSQGRPEPVSFDRGVFGFAGKLLPFAYCVKTDGPWDYKFNSYLGMQDVKVCDKRYYRDFVGNFNYGYACAALGIGIDTSLAAGGFYQFFSDARSGYSREKKRSKSMFKAIKKGFGKIKFSQYRNFFDNPGDQDVIKRGYIAYMRHKDNITPKSLGRVLNMSHEDVDRVAANYSVLRNVMP